MKRRKKNLACKPCAWKETGFMGLTGQLDSPNRQALGQ